MKIQTISFISIGELLAGNTALAIEFDEECDVSFGDASYTLIPKDKLIPIFQRIESIGADAAIEKIKSLPQDTYVDLEN